jgi:uroporphyrinogen decarboxylase
MESKERVLTVLDHKESDRVPIQASFVPQLKKNLELKYDLLDDDLYVHLGNDILTITFGMSTGFYKEDSVSYVDDYGITYKNTGVYTEIIHHPLDTDEKAWCYVPPAINKDPIVARTKQLIEKHGKTHAIAGKINQTLFESSWMLRGLERFLIDLIENPELADQLMTKMMQHHLEIGKILVMLGVDIVYTGDDVGTQQGMSISPELFRKLLKPKYTYMWNELKRINPNVKIAHHTCGNVTRIIPDFIEAGLDVLNPIQPKAMNLVELKNKYGQHLSFWGGMDIQETLPFGDRDDIFREVKDRMETLGPGGGFIIAPAHNIQIDTSVENVEHFYEAAKRYGKYPIGA